MRSARYAGEQASDEENLRKLIAEAPAGSALAYVCALAYVDPGAGASASSRRAARARLAEPAHAAIDGFGYDPAFIPRPAATSARWRS